MSFFTNLNWRFFIVDWVTASLQSQFFLWFPIPTLFILSPWGPFQVHQLQLVSPLLLCSITFQYSGKIQVFIYVFAMFLFTLWSIRRQVQSFLFIRLRLIFLLGLSYLFVSQGPREFDKLPFQEKILFVFFNFLHISLVSIAKFQFPAQFPVDPPSHPVILALGASLLHSLILY